MRNPMNVMPNETPFFFRSGSEELFGVLTQPTVEPNGHSIVLLWGSGGHPSFGANRLLLRTAALGAGLGYHVLRFDYPGTGDSSGSKPALHSLKEPAVAPDILAAVEWLEGRGLAPCVLVGNCFGGRAVLSCVPHVRSLAAVALISPPIWDDERHMETAVFHRRSEGPKVEWVSRELMDSITYLDRQGTPLLVVYGKPDTNYRIFRRAEEEDLGRFLRASARTELVVRDGPVHDFPTLASQDDFTHIMRDWLARLNENTHDHR